MPHPANPLVQTFGGFGDAGNPLQEVSPRISEEGRRDNLLTTLDHLSEPNASLLDQAMHLLRERYAPLIAHIYQADRQALRQAIADVVLSLHPAQGVAVRLTEAMEAQLLGAGALEPFMRDPDVSEIMVTGPYVYIEREGRIQPALTLPTHDDSIKLVQHLARHCQREYRDTEPLMDLTWPENGARINITHHRVARTGPAITIRKHNMGQLLQLRELLQRRMLNAAAAEFLIHAIRHKANGLIAGSTGSGKTSLLRALIMESVRPDERLIVLEDTEELRLPHRHQLNLIGHPHAVTAEERQHGQVALLDLFRNALRQRPDRIIMGELRGPEAFDFIEQGLTESGGGLSTIHLRHPSYLVSRLHYIAQKSHLAWTRDAIALSVHQAIDVIVQVSHDEDTGFRWVSQIVEPLADGTTQTLFDWNEAEQELVPVHPPSDKLRRLWEQGASR